MTIMMMIMIIFVIVIVTIIIATTTIVAVVLHHRHPYRTIFISVIAVVTSDGDEDGGSECADVENDANMVTASIAMVLVLLMVMAN